MDYDQHKFMEFGDKVLTKQLHEFITIQDKENEQDTKRSITHSRFAGNISNFPRQEEFIIKLNKA